MFALCSVCLLVSIGPQVSLKNAGTGRMGGFYRNTGISRSPACQEDLPNGCCEQGLTLKENEKGRRGGRERVG